MWCPGVYLTSEYCSLGTFLVQSDVVLFSYDFLGNRCCLPMKRIVCAKPLRTMTWIHPSEFCIRLPPTREICTFTCLCCSLAFRWFENLPLLEWRNNYGRSLVSIWFRQPQVDVQDWCWKSSIWIFEQAGAIFCGGVRVCVRGVWMGVDVVRTAPVLLKSCSVHSEESHPNRDGCGWNTPKRKVPF